MSLSRLAGVVLDYLFFSTRLLGLIWLAVVLLESSYKQQRSLMSPFSPGSGVRPSPLHRPFARFFLHKSLVCCRSAQPHLSMASLFFLYMRPVPSSGPASLVHGELSSHYLTPL